VLWHRLGEVRLAINLCGIAGLLASPVSWLHHFVWVVPFAITLAHGLGRTDRSVTTDTGSPMRLPAVFLALSWVFVGWVSAAPISRLPNGADVELSYTWSQHLLASVTAILGVALIIAAIVIARRRRAGADSRPRLGRQGRARSVVEPTDTAVHQHDSASATPGRNPDPA
jgi:alpha-1,2-mannosyltransferase